MKRHPLRVRSQRKLRVDVRPVVPDAEVNARHGAADVAVGHAGANDFIPPRIRNCNGPRGKSGVVTHTRRRDIQRRKR